MTRLPLAAMWHSACSAPPRQSTISSDRSSGLPRGNSVNLAHIIDGHDDDSVALIWRNRVTTYGELRSQVAAFRGGLAASGIGADDRVAIVVGNSPHFVIAYLATIGLGAVAVPLNPASPGPELQSELAVVGRSRRRGRQPRRRQLVARRSDRGALDRVGRAHRSGGRRHRGRRRLRRPPGGCPRPRWSTSTVRSSPC